MTIVGGTLLFYAFSALLALHETDKQAVELDKVPLKRKAVHKIKMDVLTFTSTRLIIGPIALPRRRAIAETQGVCCGGYAGAIDLINTAPQSYT